MPASRLYSDDDVIAAEVRRRLEAKSVRQLASDLGVSYQFLSAYVRRDWPHAQKKLLVSLGYEPRRYYRKRRS